MRTVKLVLGFDGTRYEGWQSQRNPSRDSGSGNTLQEVFEKTLEKIFRRKTPVVGSSRTDSGVHALGFTAHFKTKSRIPDAALKRALNFYLPKDIVVFSVKTVPQSFHARFSAKSKVYRYAIWNSPTRPLFEAPFCLWVPYPLKVGLMRRAAVYFRGKHDFSSFWDKSDDPRNPVRTVKRVVIRVKSPLIRIEIEGDGFLRHMIRVMVGTLIEVGRRKIPPAAVREILAAKNRPKAGPTAKAQGLTLALVRY
jgi:tRNA pseudouridine38-40 synthase